jgi:hypothetical protein
MLSGPARISVLPSRRAGPGRPTCHGDWLPIGYQLTQIMPHRAAPAENDLLRFSRGAHEHLAYSAWSPATRVRILGATQRAFRAVHPPWVDPEIITIEGESYTSENVPSPMATSQLHLEMHCGRSRLRSRGAATPCRFLRKLNPHVSAGHPVAGASGPSSPPDGVWRFAAVPRYSAAVDPSCGRRRPGAARPENRRSPVQSGS